MFFNPHYFKLSLCYYFSFRVFPLIVAVRSCLWHFVWNRGLESRLREARVCKQEKKKEELIDVTLYFEIAPSMILTGCKNLNSFSDKTDSRDPASNTSVPLGRHAARRVHSTVICPSHNRNGSEPQERNPPRLVDANKLWEMKVCNLEERPSSNFKPKHPSLPLGQRGMQTKGEQTCISGGPFVYVSVKVGRFPQMWT